jgi:hypothetical protein
MRYPNGSRPFALYLPLLAALAGSSLPALADVPEDPAAEAAPAVSVTGQDVRAAPPLDPPSRGVTLPRAPGSDERPRLRGFDRVLAGSYVTLSAMDAWQTGHLPPGYKEGNPLVSSWAGDRPELGEAAAFKAAMTWGVLKLTARLERPGHRRAVLILMNVVQASVVALNERRTGGILFR